MKRTLVFIVLVALSCSLQAQIFPTGDKSTLSDLARLSQRDSLVVAKHFADVVSLKDYCPTVERQIGGTCFAYASAYAGRSILYNRTNNDTSAAMKFSAGYIVRKLQRRRLGNRFCTKGASTVAACESIEKEGVVPFERYPDECSLLGVTRLAAEAAKYKAKATSLFEPCASDSLKIASIKEALANSNPVVLGMNAVTSFHRNNADATPDLWTPTDAEIKNNNCKSANHAICVVGFDDTKYGGVFEVMNSWGTDWKNKGFTYVRYSQLVQLSMFGIQLSN